MSAAAETLEPMSGYSDSLSGDEYHRPEHGLSTSVLKAFMADPAQVRWAESAPQDSSKLSAIDFGTDFHAYFLEPEKFREQYRVLPAFNRRVKAEKEAEIAMIDEWREKGIIAVTAEDMAKLEAMRQSAMAHPTVAAIMGMDGIAERSYFWTDPKTGVACKCRPDWTVIGGKLPPFVPKDCGVLAADVKTIADISRIQVQIENLKYFVQDQFYSQGIQEVTGEKVCFVFIFVSTSLSLGRYPVQVVMLDDVAKFDGRREISEALADYAAMSRADDSAWQTVMTVDRPVWATRDDDPFQ